MSSQLTIAVLFFGVILLMMCSVAFKPATKVFVGVISVLGAFFYHYDMDASDTCPGVGNTRSDVDSVVVCSGQKQEGVEFGTVACREGLNSMFLRF